MCISEYLGIQMEHLAGLFFKQMLLKPQLYNHVYFIPLQHHTWVLIIMKLIYVCSILEINIKMLNELYKKDRTVDF